MRQRTPEPGTAEPALSRRAMVQDRSARPAAEKQIGILGDLVGGAADRAPEGSQRPVAPRLAGGGWRWSLAYVQRGTRDPRCDLLRGLCVIAMVAAGLGDKSWLATVTGAQSFPLAALGRFIFIAGYVLGLTASREALGRVVRRLVARTWTLYCLAVGVTLLFSLLAVSGRFQLWYPFPAGATATYCAIPEICCK